MNFKNKVFLSSVLMTLVGVSLMNSCRGRADPNENDVTQVASNLTIGYADGDNAESVTRDITLPTTGENGVTVTWVSDNDELVNVGTSGTGIITRPDDNTMVTLTATLTKGNASTTETFTLTIIARPFAWSEVTLTSDSIWNVRRNHSALVFDNKIWVLGGRERNTDYNDVWWSNDGAAWTDANARGPEEGDEHWTNRFAHTVVVFDEKMWVLGGGNIRREFKNDVWSSSDGISWTKATDSAAWPVRYYHTSVVFDNKMWVLGGWDNSFSSLNDVWWSSDGANWTNANARGPAMPDTDPVEYGEHWSERFNYAAVVFKNKIWVLGGDQKNDVWSSSDGTNWTKVTDSANWPARTGHAAVVFDGKMWVMGGFFRDEDTDATSRFNDVWWSSDGATWTKLENDMSHWSVRSTHAAAAFDNKIWVLGGLSIGISKNDLWAYQQIDN